MAEIQQCLSIQQSLARVRERIAEAALRAGRAPEEVTLVAVSKTFPAQAVLEAIAAGQRDFGENRVEEALPKMGEIVKRRVPSDDAGLALRWHLIGHLQSRKVKDAAGHFALIHSVDSLKLATTLNTRISNLQPPVSTPQPILLECNVSGEEAKSGFSLAGWERDAARFEAFAQEVTQISALPCLRLCGLMTVAPIVEQPAQARPCFASLRALRDALRERFPGVGWDHLSMGMTNDFEPAIAEGATLVRIGRAIFGERNYA
ncbi:MAG TPA: YggS family pyridoxal phosphate-dependent enzyme [Anaerolineae bacterium]